MLSPMPAHVFDASRAVFPLFASPKLDGMRAVIRLSGHQLRTDAGIPRFPVFLRVRTDLT